MEFITNIYFTIEGQQKVIPFITEVDQNLSTYKQCIEASEIGKKLMEQHVPKSDKIKDIHYRTFEVGKSHLNLN